MKFLKESQFKDELKDLNDKINFYKGKVQALNDYADKNGFDDILPSGRTVEEEIQYYSTKQASAIDKKAELEKPRKKVVKDLFQDKFEEDLNEALGIKLEDQNNIKKYLMINHFDPDNIYMIKNIPNDSWLWDSDYIIEDVSNKTGDHLVEWNDEEIFIYSLQGKSIEQWDKEIFQDISNYAKQNPDDWYEEYDKFPITVSVDVQDFNIYPPKYKTWLSDLIEYSYVDSDSASAYAVINLDDNQFEDYTESSFNESEENLDESSKKDHKIIKESIEKYKHFIIASNDMFEDYFKDEIGLKKDINPYEFIFFTNNPDNIGLKYDDWSYIIENLDGYDMSVNDLKSIIVDEDGFIKSDYLVFILRTGGIKKRYLESSNQLKDMAKHNKKKQKGKGWFVKLNAGNPEYNASFFNRAMGNDITPSSEISSSEGTGLAEDIEPRQINIRQSLIELDKEDPDFLGSLSSMYDYLEPDLTIEDKKELIDLINKHDHLKIFNFLNNKIDVDFDYEIHEEEIN